MHHITLRDVTAIVTLPPLNEPGVLGGTRTRHRILIQREAPAEPLVIECVTPLHAEPGVEQGH